MPDNHTNLPILDDIIKPGDTDKAVHQPSSKVQSSLWSNKDRNDAPEAGSDAETSAEPAGDDLTDTTNDQSATDATSPDEVIENAGGAGAPRIEQPDLDALTDEILGNMMIEVEQQLRDRIRQTLSRHFSDETGSD